MNEFNLLIFVGSVVFVLFVWVWRKPWQQPLPLSRFPSSNLKPCPACGSDKVRVIEVSLGFLAVHLCRVPLHSQCQVKVPEKSEIAAAAAWGYQVQKWISERDITAPL